MIIIILAVMSVVFIVLGTYFDDQCLEILSVICTAIGTFAIIGLVMLLLIWPANYYATLGGIEEFKTVKRMYNDIGKDGVHNIDRAGIAKRAINENIWLAKKKYLNKSCLDMIIPDEVMELEEIR